MNWKTRMLMLINCDLTWLVVYINKCIEGFFWKRACRNRSLFYLLISFLKPIAVFFDPSECHGKVFWKDIYGTHSMLYSIPLKSLYIWYVGKNYCWTLGSGRCLSTFIQNSHRSSLTLLGRLLDFCHQKINSYPLT